MTRASTRTRMDGATQYPMQPISISPEPASARWYSSILSARLPATGRQPSETRLTSPPMTPITKPVPPSMPVNPVMIGVTIIGQDM